MTLVVSIRFNDFSVVHLCSCAANIKSCLGMFANLSNTHCHQYLLLLRGLDNLVFCFLFCLCLITALTGTIESHYQILHTRSHEKNTVMSDTSNKPKELLMTVNLEIPTIPSGAGSIIPWNDLQNSLKIW